MNSPPLSKKKCDLSGAGYSVPPNIFRHTGCLCSVWPTLALTKAEGLGVKSLMHHRLLRFLPYAPVMNPNWGWFVVGICNMYQHISSPYQFFSRSEPRILPYFWLKTELLGPPRSTRLLLSTEPGEAGEAGNSKAWQ